MCSVRAADGGLLERDDCTCDRVMVPDELTGPFVLVYHGATARQRPYVHSGWPMTLQEGLDELARVRAHQPRPDDWQLHLLGPPINLRAEDLARFRARQRPPAAAYDPMQSGDRLDQLLERVPTPSGLLARLLPTVRGRRRRG